MILTIRLNIPDGFEYKGIRACPKSFNISTDENKLYVEIENMNNDGTTYKSKNEYLLQDISLITITNAD